MDLAVAVVFGQAVTDLINSFVSSFVSPLIGILGGSSFEDLAFTINGSNFTYGIFINQAITFIVGERSPVRSGRRPSAGRHAHLHRPRSLPVGVLCHRRAAASPYDPRGELGVAGRVDVRPCPPLLLTLLPPHRPPASTPAVRAVRANQRSAALPSVLL